MIRSAGETGGGVVNHAEEMLQHIRREKANVKLGVVHCNTLLDKVGTDGYTAHTAVVTEEHKLE